MNSTHKRVATLSSHHAPARNKSVTFCRMGVCMCDDPSCLSSALSGGERDCSRTKRRESRKKGSRVWPVAAVESADLRCDTWSRHWQLREGGLSRCDIGVVRRGHGSSTGWATSVQINVCDGVNGAGIEGWS